MTSFNEWDERLQEDISQIQAVTALLPNVQSQVERLQYISTAAALCMLHHAGPQAAAHWFRQIADRLEMQGSTSVQ